MDLHFLVLGSHIYVDLLQSCPNGKIALESKQWTLLGK
jgi:hypothetical protein